MATMLITGVSGTGKSSALEALAARGIEVVDTDEPGWRRPADGPAPLDMATQPDWIWDEDRMAELLERPRSGHLVVAGCVGNQGRFADRFDHIVLLTAPPALIDERLQTRTTNPYGQTTEQRARVMDEIGWVEPLLRRQATREIATTFPLDEVVAILLADLG